MWERLVQLKTYLESLINCVGADVESRTNVA